MPGTEDRGRGYIQAPIAGRRQVNVADVGKAFGSGLEELKDAVSRPNCWGSILLPARLLYNLRDWLGNPACPPCL